MEGTKEAAVKTNDKNEDRISCRLYEHLLTVGSGLLGGESSGQTERVDSEEGEKGSHIRLLSLF